VVATLWAFTATALRYAPPVLASRRRSLWAGGAVLAVSLAALVQFGAATIETDLLRDGPRYEGLARLDAALPAEATVMVPQRLAAGFSAHARVLTYEALPLGTATGLSRETWLAALAGTLGACDLVATERQAWLDRLILDSGRFLPPQLTDGFHVFLARAEAPRPADPDAHLQRALRWGEMPPMRRRWATIRAEAGPPPAIGEPLGRRPSTPRWTAHGPA
jgi:hypothetical protein